VDFSHTVIGDYVRAASSIGVREYSRTCRWILYRQHDHYGAQRHRQQFSFACSGFLDADGFRRGSNDHDAALQQDDYGQTAIFTVAASGTSPMTYQWRKNGTAMSGATSSTYTTPAETTTDNNATFSVMVSNSAGKGGEQRRDLDRQCCRRGADNHFAACQPERECGPNSNLQRRGDGHFTDDLPVEQERSRDQRRHVVNVYHSGGNHLGQQR
jgi:hypothetical protein